LLVTPRGSPIHEFSHTQLPIAGPRFTQRHTSFIYTPPIPVKRPSLPSATLSSTTFTAKFLADVKETNSSRYNFAVREWFNEETRKASNMFGRCDKKCLDSQKMQQIKEAIFQMYFCSGSENQVNKWKRCHRAIDESCQQLNREK